jgi:hypothetical protein
VFYEAAEALAERMLDEGGDRPETQIAWGYRRALLRDPGEAVAAELLALYQDALTHYREANQPQEKVQPVSDRQDQSAEQAALAAVANAILNLDAFISKQ